MFDWLAVYHRLPYRLKSTAASARGYYLQRWRYGRDTEDLVNQALERDNWSQSQWAEWQAERLAFILEHAAKQVPYYRDMWARRRRHGDRAAWDVLGNWPILTKEEVRETPEAFVADGCTLSGMFEEHSSGTTGKPVRIWLSRQTLRSWFALFEARARRWYGVSGKDRWAIVGGKLVAPIERTRPPYWVWNRAMNQLYLSAYHLTPDSIGSYLEAMEKYGVTYLLGYPSGMYRMAQLAMDSGLRAPRLQVIVGNAEPLLFHQRNTLAGYFGCPVRDTYGMAEVAAAASECQYGNLHIWPEVGLWEVLDRVVDSPVELEQAGRLVASGLLNADMPLIRYETGDQVSLPPTAAPVCACGRGLPRVQALEGRLDDVIIAPDGRHIGRLTMVFEDGLRIREAQIVQDEPKILRVLYVPAADYEESDGALIVRRIQQRVGQMEVLLEPVDEIPRTANGKFRGVICRLPTQKHSIQGHDQGLSV